MSGSLLRYFSNTGMPRELPDTYVLTITHCGGGYVNCGADKFPQFERIASCWRDNKHRENL